MTVCTITAILAEAMTRTGRVICALMHAGLPSDEYSFGGRHWGKQWHLDVDGALTEWTAEDPQAELDPEPEKHCKGGRTGGPAPIPPTIEGTRRADSRR